MSGIDSSGRIAPTASGSSSSSSIIPSFLTDHDEAGYKPYSSPTSSSSNSPTHLAYLRESPSSSSRSSRVNGSSSRGIPATARPSMGGRGTSDSSGKRRPRSLEGGKGRVVGLDEDLGEQGQDVAADTDMQDVSSLRHSLRQLHVQGNSSPARLNSGPVTPQLDPLSEDQTIPLSEILDLLSTSVQMLVIDTRPLGLFLESHFPRSANISIPSLILKRFRKASSARATTWESLAGFVSTTEGKDLWERLDRSSSVDVVVVGLTAADELAMMLRGIVEGLVNKGSVRVLRGGWAAVLASSAAGRGLVSGEESETDLDSPPRSAPPASTPGTPPRVSHHPSMPSLRSDGPSKLAVPSGSSKRPPKLSLNLDNPLRSAILSPEPLNLKKKTSMLTINIANSNRGPKTPMTASFQTLCHAQSKLPPSPSSFGDVKRIIGHDEDFTQSPADTARPDGLHPAPATPALLTARNGLTPFIVSTILPSFLFLGPEITSQDDIDALKRLGIKRILNVALECNDDEGLMLKDKFERYYRVPMRDIVEESGVAKGMKDACDFLGEVSVVAALTTDDARLHSAPTYVHCKAGKSRSVTVVLAYLIHANAWTLKTSYAYVAERRKGISPNIGFVAELMQFEEAELGLRQSGGVHGESSGKEDVEKGPNPRHMRESLPPAWASNSLDARPRKILPPGRDPSEVDDKASRQRGDEREVRKNGHWVHHRKAPVDRTTLQPGRRVSKAGLESLRSLNPAVPTPGPRTGETDKTASTPGVDGRLGWV